jgi:hypothetical protein
MDHEQECFTAAELARFLGRSKRGINKALQSAPPTCRKTVRGEKLDADAWAISALPVRLADRARSIATERGHKTVERAIRQANTQEESAPAGTPDIFERDRAERLRSILRPLLCCQHKLSSIDLQHRGVADYEREFGQPITRRQFLGLFDRIVKRDEALEQWDRIELYFDERRRTSSPALVPSHIHAPLNEVIEHLDDRACPTIADREWLWDSAFRHLEEIAVNESKSKRCRLKASLIYYLLINVPGLCDSERSLKRCFNRGYSKWIGGGKTRKAIEDRRQLNSGKFSDGPCAACRDLFIGGAADLQGNMGLAWERLHSEKLFCVVCSARWPFNPQNKDALPQAFSKFRPLILMELDRRKSGAQRRAAGPKIARDWSCLAPGESFSADDITLNHPFWYKDADGKVCVSRGETLLLTEERTGYIVHYVLVAGLMEGKRTSYTGWNIRQLILGGHDRFGLPHSELSFENGVWRSRLVAGEAKAHWESAHWRDAERGLQEYGLGLQIHHHLPRQPWSKPIEAIIGLMQKRMSHLPFYIGRDERRDRQEKVQELLRQIRSGKVMPWDVGMPSMEDYRNWLDEEIRKYNSTIQNGAMLQDCDGIYLSPEQALRKGICGKPGIEARPLRKLSAEARAQLSTHRRKVRVTERGIELELRGRRCPYWGSDLADFKYKEVFAYICIEAPSVLVVSDLKRQQFFTVTMKTLPARGATAEEQQAISRERAAFLRPSKVLHSNLPHPFRSNITNDNINEQTRELGRAVNSAIEAHQIEETAEQRTVSEVKKLCKLLGRQPPRTMKNPQTVLEGLRIEYELRQEMEAENV